MKLLLVALFYLSASVLMTWPLVRDGWSKIAGDLGDPLLLVWVMRWEYHALSQGNILGLFHANAFYPAPYSLAFSDHMLPNLLIFGPAFAITENPIFSYNLVFFLSFVLSGLAMHTLAFYWTRSHSVSLVAGFIFAFFPARFAQIGHLQLLNLYWTPLALLFLDKDLRSRRWSHLVWFSLMAVLQTGASFYAGYFLIFVLSIYYGLFHVWYRKPPGMRDAVAPVIILCGVLPLALPYLKTKALFGFERGFFEIMQNSADLGKSFLSVPPYNWLYGDLLASFRATAGASEKSLFVGFVPLVLVVLAAVRLKGNHKDHQDHKGRFLLVVCFVILIFAATLSLGPGLLWFESYQFSPLPYRVLYEVVPGFSSLRVPARMMMVGMVAVAALAALGIPGGSRWRRVLVPALLATILLEYRIDALPMAEIAAGEQVPKAYRWLKRQQLEGALIEIPAGDERAEVQYMYFSTYHFKPIVNGYSGFVPGYYVQTRAELSRPVSERTLTYLKGIGVSTILLHRDRTRAEGWDRLVDEGKVRELARFGEDQVLSIDISPTAGRLKVENLEIDYASPGSSLEVGVVLNSSGELWRKPRPHGLEEVGVIWKKGDHAFYQTSKFLVPLAVAGETWVPLRLETPSSPGVYDISVRSEHFSIRKRVVISDRDPEEALVARGKIQDGAEELRRAMDGDFRTAWLSKRVQSPGRLWDIDLSRQVESRGIKLHVGGWVNEYPRGLRVYLSEDGLRWARVEDAEYVWMLNGDNFAAVRWAPRSARFIRLEIDGYSDRWWLVVTEIEVYGPADSADHAD